MLFLIAITSFAEGRAKYVFYFIGDGMGVNQVNGTETYLAALQGRIGVEPLLFTQFPAVGLVTTFSATNGVTDSAAAGTALSTGRKTKNSALGMLADLQTPVTSVAVWAQQSGAAVGISTNVSVDHATPAAFYAHQPMRDLYYEIGKDLIKADFDFYAGSDFRIPENKKDSTATGTLFERRRDTPSPAATSSSRRQASRRRSSSSCSLLPQATTTARVCLTPSTASRAT